MIIHSHTKNQVFKLLFPLLGDFNVNRNTTPSLYEKVVKHLKTNDLQTVCDQPHHNLWINIGPCFHWRIFTINNLQRLLLLRLHDTFNSEKNSLTIKR
jgi:hypothetical protein